MSVPLGHFKFWFCYSNSPDLLLHSEIVVPRFHVRVLPSEWSYPGSMLAFCLLPSVIILPRFPVAFCTLSFAFCNFLASIPCWLFLFSSLWFWFHLRNAITCALVDPKGTTNLSPPLTMITARCFRLYHYAPPLHLLHLLKKRAGMVFEVISALLFTEDQLLLCGSSILFQHVSLCNWETPELGLHKA